MDDYIGCLCKDFYLKISKSSLTWSDGTNVQCSYFEAEENEVLEFHKSNKRQQFSGSITIHNPFTRWDGFPQNNVHLREQSFQQSN